MSQQFALIQNLGPWEIGAIVLIILLLFGGKKLPELARGAGKALKEFRSATAEAEKTFKSALDETEPDKQKPQSDTAGTPPAKSADGNAQNTASTEAVKNGH